MSRRIVLIATLVLAVTGAYLVYFGWSWPPDGIPSATKSSFKGATLDFSRLDEQAVIRSDATILRPRATQVFVGTVAASLARTRAAGLRREDQFVKDEFKAFRRVGSQYEVDVVSTWNLKTYDRQGSVVTDAAGQPVSQTVVLLQEQGQWKVSDVRFYEPGNIPF